MQVLGRVRSQTRRSATPGPPGGRAAWIAWAIAASAYLVDLLHRMSLGVAALDAEHRLGVGAGAVTVLAALQIAVYVVGQIPAGLLADRIGARRTLLLGLVVMAGGEALFAVSHTFGLSLLGRVLLGAGDATIFLSVLRVAAHWFPRRQFPLVTALTQAAGCAGQVATTVPLTLALHGLGWTATFATAAALTLVVAALILVGLRERPAGDPAPARHAHPPVLAGLRAAWALPGTRRGCVTHLALMTPFGVLSSLWGHPYLVEVVGLRDGAASALLLVGVVASGLAAPVIGLAVSRAPGLRGRLTVAVGAAMTAALAALVGFGAAAPAVVLVLAFGTLGVGAAGSMIAFDLARRSDDGHNGGSVSALVNLGGWSATVVMQGALAVTHAVTVSRWMLVPLLVLTALATLRLAAYGDWRRAARRVRTRMATA